MDDLPENTKDRRIGNQFWKNRTKHGRDVLIKDPEKLQEACCEYFEWVEENPLIEEKIGFYEGRPARADCAKMRAMTIEGLTIYLGIVPSTWYDWRKNRKDLSETIRWADNVMRNQTLTGAASGLLNHSIIGRVLGLHDITALQHLDKDGETTDPTTGVTIIAGSELVAASVAAFDKGIEEEKARAADAEDTA